VVGVCGRYASGRDPRDLAGLFGVDRIDPVDEAADGAGNSDAPAAGDLPPDWNIAPTKSVYAVLERTDRGQPAARPVRRLRPVRWGLVPSWAASPKVGTTSMINARVETVATKPAYRAALASRRCLLPADGYYEWAAGPDGAKTPYFLAPRDGGVLGMAGLYELWRDAAKHRDDPAAWLWSAVILTTRAINELGHLHDRMPVLVEPANYTAWLDPRRTDPVTALALLAPPPADWLRYHPVSRAVGNVANNGPQLAQPVSVFG
jgi:putative SOS response-associated peptidase YedK